MAEATTSITLKKGEEHHAANVNTNVTTRAANLSEPANSDHIEVLFLEASVLTKEEALLLLKAVELNLIQNDWPR